MSEYYPGCVQMPGPPGNVYPDTNLNLGIILHSAEGDWSALYTPMDTQVQQGVSFHFTVFKDGTVWQHYALSASCWHAGTKNGNLRLIGVEHEGRTGEPLTEPQVAASVALTKWVALQGRWALSREPGPGQTLWEHHEVSHATTCPNGRIPWARYMEDDVQVTQLDQPQSIAFLQQIAANVANIVSDNGATVFELETPAVTVPAGYKLYGVVLKEA